MSLQCVTAIDFLFSLLEKLGFIMLEKMGFIMFQKMLVVI